MPNGVSKRQHPVFDTSTRARVKAVCEWEAAQGHTGYHEKVFRWAIVGHTQGWKILSESPGTLSNESPRIETRGRPSKVAPEDIYAIEEAIKEHRWTT